MPLAAGAATTDITPPTGLPMGGYGARTSPATGMHDALQARVLVLSDGQTEVAIVVCDLLGAPLLLVEPVRREAAKLGLQPENVLVAATHTHSGPSVVYSRRLTDYLLAIAAKIGECIGAARAATQPAELRAGRAQIDTISQNRRDPAGPIQREAEILSITAADGSSQIATLVNYACHATVLEHDNLLWSADFAGAACRFIEQALGGVAIYLQGCCGDINPLWVRHDFAEVERVGGIVGSAAARTVLEMAPVGGPGQFGINLSWSQEIRQDPEQGALIDDIRLVSERTSIELERRKLASLDELNDEIAALERRLDGLSGDDPGRRGLMPRLNQLNMERTVQTYHQLQPPERQSVEVQAIRLSPKCAIVSLPGEFFVATGSSLVGEAGIDHLLVAGYANDYIGYVPPAEEFPKGGYEVGFARFGVETEAAVRKAALEALRRVAGAVGS